MRRILIIDDEEDIREIAALSLEATAGWSITSAASGPEGIRHALAAHPKPDAILMDVMMPGMDGPATLLQIQQIPGLAHIPVLLLTARVQEADRRRFAALGAAAILAKPFNPLTLAALIAEALNWFHTPQTPVILSKVAREPRSRWTCVSSPIAKPFSLAQPE